MTWLPLLCGILCLAPWSPVESRLYRNMSREDLYKEVLRQVGPSAAKTRQTNGRVRLYSSTSFEPHYLTHEVAHVPPEPAACSAEDILQEDMRLSCGPRKTLVPLPPAPPDVIRLPQLAEVYQCSGSCFQSLYCDPIATSAIAVPVLHVNFSSGEPVVECSHVTMIEHKRCRCACRLQRHDCNSKQIYSEDECSCKCRNVLEAFECMEMDKIWRPLLCSCECPRILVCSTGFHFNHDSCRCERRS
ncbi:platelet-derived growth factor subunit A-like isoform X2 [Ornithodoros turicata]|uniref:platelet-derived growth factor subunit A-like isoform X2 n=1 Tax=Ornithodoros turicata TaxID=34597 RepID=UPI0031387EC0